MNRLTTLQDFVGKTIDKIDDSSCNMITIVFTDGTKLILEGETVNTSLSLIGIGRYS